jgi:predicted homoserine dehydrogenase-like protein
MIYSSEPTAVDKVVEAGVIGTGQYATAIVTQAQSIPQLNIPIVADTEIESAKRAYQLAGIDGNQVIVADTRAQALSGIERGKKVVVAEPDLLIGLPLEVDATAGAVHATTALQNGKHVVMITKETENDAPVPTLYYVS